MLYLGTIPLHSTLGGATKGQTAEPKTRGSLYVKLMANSTELNQTTQTRMQAREPQSGPEVRCFCWILGESYRRHVGAACELYNLGVISYSKVPGHL